MATAAGSGNTPPMGLGPDSTVSISESQLESVLDTARAKGMFMVGQDTLPELLAEYERTTRQVEGLCEAVDPEETPYKSKYQARELLDTVCNKLEATRTVALLEKNMSTVEQADMRIGAIRVKLGVISYEVEEPHNAQTDLELAGGYYFPNFVKNVQEVTAQEDENVGKPDAPAVSADDIDRLDIPPLDLPQPTMASVNAAVVHLDALKCLNMLGILWAGRGRITKSFLYLKASKDLYNSVRLGLENGKYPKPLTADQMKDLESTYTHSLFYLAQAYGHVGNAEKSSLCCKETLQRQYSQGISDRKVKLEWAKNCAAMADFYLSSQLYRHASMALRSAEYVTRAVLDEQQETPSPLITDTCNEQLADLNRRFAHLDLLLLRRAKDRHEGIVNSLEYGIEWTEDEDVELQMIAGQSDAANSSSSSHDIKPLFEGIPVTPLPLMGVTDVNDFESARSIYLRASNKLEQAKKYFLLDGTDYL
jgi:tetratricopeptide (TPR) repeat protein